MYLYGQRIKIIGSLVTCSNIVFLHFIGNGKFALIQCYSSIGFLYIKISKTLLAMEWIKLCKSKFSKVVENHNRFRILIFLTVITNYQSDVMSNNSWSLKPVRDRKIFFVSIKRDHQTIDILSSDCMIPIWFIRTCKNRYLKSN